MALAIDASTPAVASTTTSTTVTTASFTPPAGSLLLLMYGANHPTAGTDTSISLVTNTGVSLSTAWTRLARKNTNASSTGGAGTNGGAEIWGAVCSSSVATTVTVTGVGTNVDKVVKILVLTGADAAALTNVGGASSTSGLPSVTLSGCQIGSYVFAASSDWQANGSATAGSGQTMIDQYHNVGQISIHYWRTTSTLAAAGSQTMDLTAPAAQQYDQVAIEIRASGGAPAASFVPPPADPPRRLRGLPPRRPRAFPAAPAQVILTASTYPPLPVRPRLRGARLNRDRISTPVPTQIIVAAPAYPLRPARGRRWPLRQARPRAVTPPADQASLPALERVRLKLPRLFRARVAQPTPAQIVLTAPSYVPPSVRSRIRGLRLFRGRSAGVVPSQIVLVPPAFVPPDVRLRLKWVRLFRGRATAPPPEQLDPTPSPRLRPRGMAPRRGHIATPVPPQASVAPPAYPVRPVRARLRGMLPRRAHQAPMPAPPQIVLVPPKQVPLFARLKQHAARIFRGDTRTPVVEVCDCQTHRPNLGTTSRPTTGFTARPGSGTTARPGIGLTARTDNGTTARPCSCGND